MDIRCYEVLFQAYVVGWGSSGGRGAGDNEESKETKETPVIVVVLCYTYLSVCGAGTSQSPLIFLPLLLSSSTPALPPGLTLHCTIVAHRGLLLARSSHLLLPVSSRLVSSYFRMPVFLPFSDG